MWDQRSCVVALERMLCAVEWGHARAAQRVKTSTVQELNASRDEREQP